MAGAGNGNAKNGSRDNGGGGPRRYTLSLSLPGMVVAVAVLVFGLAWTFAIGVLVGRGYTPESAVPEIAALMPGAANSSKGEVQVLKPEDLQYLDDLTRKPAAPPASLTAKAPEKPKPADKPADKPTDKAGNKTALSPAVPAPATAPAPPVPAPPAPATAPLDADASGQVFRYVYQVAAFPDPTSAQEFRTRLAGIGLASSLEKTVDSAGRTWHRVLVRFTGAPGDTQTLKDKLAGIGVSRVILRDKKPN
jgi:cell division protein FtsN